eukprot:sb/3467510/
MTQPRLLVLITITLYLGLHAISMHKSIKKVIDDANTAQASDVDLCDRNISDITEYVSTLSRLKNLTRITLSHNKLTNLPTTISEIKNLESLNLFNNHLESLPASINDLQKLKHLNVAVNRLWELPRGFGACPVLQVLDVTYNNLKELPNNFHYLNTLRALYIGDNDFKKMPEEIATLKNLQILSLRDNELTELPASIGQLTKLNELLVQNNFLVFLPVELTLTDLTNPKNVFRAEGNPFNEELQKQIDTGKLENLWKFLASPEYEKVLASVAPLDANAAQKDKTLKKSRKGQKK